MIDRAQFPLLKNNPLVYLDSAATTQKPFQVIDGIRDFYSSEYANVHRSLYPLGDRATLRYENARKKVQHFLGAASEKEIIFTSGTTASINLLAQSFTEALQPGDRILLTEMEHHSNLVPWQLAAERKKLLLDFIPVNEQGRLDLDNLDSLFHEKTKLLSLTHLSNLLGTVNPIKEIITKAHKHGIAVAIDAAQSAARIPLDVQDLDCDFLAFSGHKLYGPTGIGVLYGKEKFLKDLPPWMGGGDMISSVSLEKSTWNELPWKYEAGTPNIAGAVGMAIALDWMEKIGQEAIMNHEKELTGYALKLLKKIPELQFYGSGSGDQLGLISFNIKEIHAHDSVQFLSHKGLALRAGHHCAQPMIRKLGVSSTLRASFGVYTNKEDINKLAEGLKETIAYFQSKGII